MRGRHLKAADRKEKKIWEDGHECIWVEGYKGTHSDMTCRDFQYEMNKEFVHDGEVERRGRGFHFSTKLKDVFDHYSLDDKNRFFKVRALVYKDDYDEHYNVNTAKKIIFTEELGYEDLKDFIEKKMPLVKSEEVWDIVRKTGYEEYRRCIFVEEFTDIGYTELLANVIFDNVCTDEESDVLKFARALKEEDVSKEMSIYLICNKFV